MLIPKLYFDDSLSNFFEGDSTKMKCDIYEKEINIMLKWICLVSRRMKLRLNAIKAI